VQDEFPLAVSFSRSIATGYRVDAGTAEVLRESALTFELAGFGELFSGAKRPTAGHTRMSARQRKPARLPARILVVDAESQARSTICATLEGQGHEVRMAASGLEALEMLGQIDFDLVLTEVVVGDGNGIALMEQIREQQPQLPVVMVTAVHDINVAIDSMHRGAYDYLLKPFDGEHLLAGVRRALDHRKTLQESYSHQQKLEHAVQARTGALRFAPDVFAQGGICRI